MGDTSCWDSKLQTTLFRMFVAKPVICLIAFVAFASANYLKPLSDSDWENNVIKYVDTPAVPGFTSRNWDKNKACLWSYNDATYYNVKTLGDCQKSAQQSPGANRLTTIMSILNVLFPRKIKKQNRAIFIALAKISGIQDIM